MKEETLPLLPDRRHLLTRVLPAGALACLACRGAFAATEPVKSGSGARVEMSYDDMFSIFYTQGIIPTMKAMAAEIGRADFVELLKRSASKAAEETMRARLEANPKNDLATFTADMRNPGPLYRHTLSFEILEDTPTAFEASVTACLWAKTFRAADAADIGHALLCHPEIAATKVYNPRIRTTQSKTLMEGNDRCWFRYVLEG